MTGEGGRLCCQLCGKLFCAADKSQGSLAASAIGFQWGLDRLGMLPGRNTAWPGQEVSGWDQGARVAMVAPGPVLPDSAYQAVASWAGFPQLFQPAGLRSAGSEVLM